MPGWDGFDIPQWFAGRYSAPVLVDNDVNIMALGEYWMNWREVSHLLMIKVGTGIGCGIIASGEIHRGARGAVPPRPSCRQLRASRRVVFAESASMTAVCSRTWPAASQPAAGPAPAVARPVAGKLRGTCRLEAALSGFRAHR